jgi:sugar phosphate isomerase/epimerase
MPDLTLYLGVKTDPVEYRYSYEWLFRLMAEEGVKHAQLGSFFEMYWLPDEFFHDLRQQAQRFGVRISSVFTTHRELGGLFRHEPGFHDVALRSLRRMIEIGALLGADSVGGSAGSVLRDRMADKASGTRRYLDAMKTLLPYAHRLGVSAVIVEPMSCLAEPPTTPDEIVAWAEEMNAYRRLSSAETAAFGYCVDIAHGYLDGDDRLVSDNVQLFEATLPYLRCVHLKDTNARFESTFGFTEVERARGIVEAAAFRDLLVQNASVLPTSEVVGYLEIAGPKLGRDYSDCKLEGMLRESLRHLREIFQSN